MPGGSMKEDALREAHAERLPDDLEPDRRRQQDHDPVDLEPPDEPPHVRCRSVKNSGEKCQMASFGHSSRSPPPAKPQPMAKGSAAHSPAKRRRQAHHGPTMAPAYGPASRPARKEPESVRSAAS
jgi:hypothetical protein